MVHAWSAIQHRRKDPEAILGNLGRLCPKCSEQHLEQVLLAHSMRPAGTDPTCALYVPAQKCVSGQSFIHEREHNVLVSCTIAVTAGMLTPHSKSASVL